MGCRHFCDRLVFRDKEEDLRYAYMYGRFMLMV
jgi:hypothetical protein